MQPNIFDKTIKEDSLGDQDLLSTGNKIRQVELSEGVARELEVKLSRLMDVYKPHLDAEISLAKLASMLGITAHQLSELLNIYLETNFYDFLNALRFKEAIRLISDHPDAYSITDIAYLAGFNNRNSFYKVFRKYEGVTPGEYRKRCVQTG